MPDRILRAKILQSDRWLDLPRNTHRLAFVCLIPRADALGNMEASDGALWRIWREPLRLDNRQAVPEILEALVAADLVKLYPDGDGKRFLHIPRYRQRLRYLGRICPPSPWTTDEEKQRLAKNSPGDSQAHTGRSPAEVKRSEVKRSEEKQVVPNPKLRARSAPTVPTVNTVVENLTNPKTKPVQRSREEQLAFVAQNTKGKP